jgi:putative ABC transport system permease protein
MTFLAIASTNVRRHPLRSGLTCAGVAVAVASVIGFMGLSRGMERAWESSLRARGTHVVAVRKGAIEILAASLDEKLAGRLRQVDGVAAVSGELGDLVETETGEMAYVSGWPMTSELWRTLSIEHGDLSGVADCNGVAVGATLAGLLGRQLGDSVQVGGRAFRVTAVARESSALNERSIILALPCMQDLVGRQGKVNGFHIRVSRPEDREEMAAVLSRLSSAFPDLTFAEAGNVAENNRIAKLLRAIAWSCSTVAFAMASMTVLNTLLMAVVQRGREMGMLSAVGWMPARVMAMVVLEGLILVAAGAIAGILGGLACLRLLAAHPKLGTIFQPEVTARIIGEAAVFALLLGFAGALYPAWRATRVRPVELLKGN